MNAARPRDRNDAAGAPSERSSPPAGVVWLLGGAFGAALATQTVLSSPELFAGFGSRSLWASIVSTLGAPPEPTPNGSAAASVSFARLWLLVSSTPLIVAALCALVTARGAGGSPANRFGRVARDLGRWCLVPSAWEALRLAAFSLGWTGGESFLHGAAPLFFALGIAGGLTALFSRHNASRTASLAAGAGEGDRASDVEEPSTLRRQRLKVAAAALTYFVVFTAMNWQLYRGLLVPHGDTVMYEEHLWNLLHGKGFRSYLDQGLFLGEHLQVIHALLIPLYLLWPSHLLLELCSSAALAAGTIPVYCLARRHSGNSRAATWLAVGYLLAAPVQFLDIAIDLKTFRPTSFVIPLLLAALDQFERRRWKSTAGLLAVVLSAQEDLALVLAPLGVWMFVSARGRPDTKADDLPALRSQRRFGIGLAVVATAYLLLALLVVIPWFRAGNEVHYTAYFGELGRSPGEIARSVFTKPVAFFGKLLSARSLTYALLLLAPFGFLPLRSAGRLLVAAPLFAALCLMDTSSDPANQGVELLIPFHHFHAPLVPVIVWAAAAGLRVASGSDGDAHGRARSTVAVRRARFAAAAAFATGLFLSLSPLGVAFWDPGSAWHWRALYVVGPRGATIDRVVARIPRSARVASTDFVHPRFTHHERSYDYSGYRRRAAGYEDRVPDDTDYIVLDTRHRYSTIRNPGDVRELNEEPDRWELLPDDTGGLFIVLKRVR